MNSLKTATGQLQSQHKYKTTQTCEQKQTNKKKLNQIISSKFKYKLLKMIMMMMMIIIIQFSSFIQVLANRRGLKVYIAKARLRPELELE
jgi:hypothetical protein